MTGGRSRAEFDALNLGFAERLYRRYLQDDRSVSERWRRLFRALPSERPGPRTPSFAASSIFAGTDGEGHLSDAVLRERVERLVSCFLAMGHRAATVDPLEGRRRDPEELDPRFHRIRGAALDRTIPYGIERDVSRRSVRWILRHLRQSYCGPIGVEFMHIRDRRARAWIRRRMETRDGEERLDRDGRLRLFQRLTEAAVFEEFVRKKFVGSKSYSLEGAESLLLFLDAVVDGAAGQEIDEIVLAMTHRGRLDVLANLLDKPARQLFHELRDDGVRDQGDLRHHLGASTDRRSTCGRPVHLSLCFNPSHLEFVGPIALGRTRAKQEREGDRMGRRGVPLVVHGDAAFAGEGVVHELLNLSRLPAYDVGGAVHLVVDNQIGFTTPPEEGRSSEYATDAALMLGVPILHVNADEPESVVRAGSMAMDYRRRFRRDVVVDLRCYRPPSPGSRKSRRTWVRGAISRAASSSESGIAFPSGVSIARHPPVRRADRRPAIASANASCTGGPSRIAHDSVVHDRPPSSEPRRVARRLQRYHREAGFADGAPPRAGVGRAGLWRRGSRSDTRSRFAATVPHGREGGRRGSREERTGHGREARGRASTRGRGRMRVVEVTRRGS